MQCITTEIQFNQINILYDESKKKAHDTRIVRDKENIKFSHGGPNQRQPSGTIKRI